MVQSVNKQLTDIMAWRDKWQVKFAPDKTQAMVISRSQEDTRQLQRRLRLGRDTIYLQDSVDILGVEVDSQLRFDRHLENVARKASQKVSLLRRLNHLLTPDGLLTLYKAQVGQIMEYAPLTWMSSARCHLNLLDRVQRRAERLICGANLSGHQQPWRRQQHQRQHQQQQQRLNNPASAAAEPAVRDSLDHRRRVAALTVLHKAQIQQVIHLRDLETAWRRSERSIRTVLSNDSLLEVPESHSSPHQRSFSVATVVLWNSLTTDVDVWRLSTHQKKVATHVWLRLHSP